MFIMLAYVDQNDSAFLHPLLKDTGRDADHRGLLGMLGPQKSVECTPGNYRSGGSSFRGVLTDREVPAALKADDKLRPAIIGGVNDAMSGKEAPRGFNVFGREALLELGHDLVDDGGVGHLYAGENWIPVQDLPQRSGGWVRDPFGVELQHSEGFVRGELLIVA
jgi:hypothetical protein